jgi:rhamnogalacturonan endolyase
MVVYPACALRRKVFVHTALARWTVALSALFLTSVPAFGQVTLTDNGPSVTLANGVVTATIQKNNGQITSMTLGNLETVHGNVYYSMDGGSTYQQPGPCVYSITSQTQDLIDLSFFQVYANQPHAFDIDIHYVMQTGDSGVYSYAILNHPSTYPVTSVGEWRTVWKHPDDGANFTFEKIYVDDARHGLGPSLYDIQQASPTSIAEVVHINTGPLAGQYFGKYDYNAEYYTLGTWGHASDVNQAGVWVVLGSFEFLNDGPPKQDLTIAEGYTLLHYGRNHYGGSSTNVAAGESWSKIYGPWLLYMNSCPSGADACWAGAKARALTEQTAWPYPWLTTTPLYPQGVGRGSITGTLIVQDRLKPSVTGGGAWVGLAQPDPNGNWQNESKRYQYWVTADSSGNFTIPNVRPGTYTLYAFTAGSVGEYSRANVTVNAGGTTDVGAVTWNVYHPGNTIAWEIGIPDRSAAEFRHGGDYFQAFLYDNFANELPNPLDYIVGSSDYTTDWNYAQTAYNVGGTLSQWPWNIHFNLDSVPAGGNATLSLAWASTDHAALQVFVNDPDMLNPPLADFFPSIDGGNALIREGIHAKYGVDYVSIPTSLLQPGANTITLLQRRGIAGIGNHVMYDYINLELPAAGIVTQTLNASLTDGSLEGTTFPVTFSYDASQVSPTGESYVPLLRFDFTLLGVPFTRDEIFQGGQAIFQDGVLQNVTASYQVILPPNSPVRNITFGFGDPGSIGYIDLDGQFGNGSFTISGQTSSTARTSGRQN